MKPLPVGVGVGDALGSEVDALGSKVDALGSKVEGGVLVGKPCEVAGEVADLENEVASVKGVGAQPHPVITVIVVPELEKYGELEQ